MLNTKHDILLREIKSFKTCVQNPNQPIPKCMQQPTISNEKEDDNGNSNAVVDSLSQVAALKTAISTGTAHLEGTVDWASSDEEDGDEVGGDFELLKSTGDDEEEDGQNFVGASSKYIAAVKLNISAVDRLCSTNELPMIKKEIPDTWVKLVKEWEIEDLGAYLKFDKKIGITRLFCNTTNVCVQ